MDMYAENIGRPQRSEEPSGAPLSPSKLGNRLNNGRGSLGASGDL